MNDTFCDPVNAYLRSLCAPDKERCGGQGPWEGCQKCVLKHGHRGMHFDRTGWWSDDQAAEATARIVESIHGE